jgi:hypothetical protein
LFPRFNSQNYLCLLYGCFVLRSARQAGRT